MKRHFGRCKANLESRIRSRSISRQMVRNRAPSNMRINRTTPKITPIHNSTGHVKCHHNSRYEWNHPALINLVSWTMLNCKFFFIEFLRTGECLGVFRQFQAFSDVQTKLPAQIESWQYFLLNIWLTVTVDERNSETQFIGELSNWHATIDYNWAPLDRHAVACIFVVTSRPDLSKRNFAPSNCS